MEKSLYQITADQSELFNQIIENDGELSTEMEQQLELNKDNFEQKARGYIWKLKENDSQNDTIDKEIERLKSIKNRNEKLSERLKENLKNALIIFGDTQKVDTFTLSLRKSKAVEIVDVNSIPEEYRNIKITVTANKDEIKKAIESGLVVAGATIKENQNLQIK